MPKCPLSMRTVSCDVRVMDRCDLHASAHWTDVQESRRLRVEASTMSCIFGCHAFKALFCCTLCERPLTCGAAEIGRSKQ